MRSIRTFLFLISSVLCVSSTPVPLHNDKIVEYVQENLSTCGTLENTSDGLVYLRVDPQYIQTLFPLLEQQFKDKHLVLPSFYSKGRIGAHVSVILPDENHPPKKIQEIGQRYCFSVDGLYSAQVQDRQVYYLKVVSLDLEKLREKYKLPAKYKDHDLHITIGWEKP
jgi:hypothetical protein